MPKFTHPLLACFFVFTLGVMAQDSSKLTLSFEGLSNTKGNILLKVTEANGSEIVKKVVPVQSQTPEIALTLPQGKYAIAAFHDENANQKLDKNFAGLPKEKYGFSNNVRGAFGPPDLDDQLITLKGDLKISILLE